MFVDITSYIRSIKIKNYGKVTDHCHYTGKYRGATNSV